MIISVLILSQDISSCGGREILEAAGPAFIKWGQWAATRHDLFPPDFCEVLEQLHTQVCALKICVPLESSTLVPVSHL